MNERMNECTNERTIGQMYRAQASPSIGGDKQLDKRLLDLIIQLLLADTAPSVVQPALSCLLATVAVTPSHSRAAFAPLITSGSTTLHVCQLLYRMHSGGHVSIACMQISVSNVPCRSC